MNQPDKPVFDFETAFKQLQSGQALTGKGGILILLIKQSAKNTLKARTEHYLE